MSRAEAHHRGGPSGGGGDPSTSRSSPEDRRRSGHARGGLQSHDLTLRELGQPGAQLPGRRRDRRCGNFRKDIIIDATTRPGRRHSYKLFRAWVSEYQALAELDASANAVAIQTIKLENEGWERDASVTEPAET